MDGILVLFFNLLWKNVTAPSFRTMLVLLPVQWRKVLERLGCSLNQEDNSAGGSWMLCECSVWSNVKLRLEVSAAGLASPGSSSFLGRAHRALPRRAPCARGRAAASLPAGFRCFLQAPGCSVLLVLLLWNLGALGEASVRPASPGWELQLLLLWWDCLNKKLKIILDYFCGSQTKPQKLFIQALTKCDKIPFIKGVSKVGQFLYGLIFFLY